jgi:hypothetical protein
MPEMEEVEIIGIVVGFGSSQALICIMNMAAIKYNATKNWFFIHIHFEIT